MKRSRAAAAALIVVIVVLVAIALFIQWDVGLTFVWGLPGIGGLWALGFGVVGYLIAIRQADNPIGWLLLFAGVFAAVNTGLVPLAFDGRLPAAWETLAGTTWVPSLAAMVTALALMPDGSLPGQRWRAAVVALWTVVVLVMVAVFPRSPLAAASVAIEAVLQIALAVVLGAALVRFRRSTGIVRQQLKWIAFVVSLVAVTALAVQLVIANLLPRWYILASALLSIAILGVPVAIGLAIFRYRLYDIDRLVSRTVGYGIVVGCMGAVYAFGAVWLPSRLVGDQPPLFVAAATLAAAALFDPVRRWVLHRVDRLFYRSRYDLSIVADDFSSHLRAGIDLETLTDEWVGVVTATMRPASIGMWVRERK